MKTILQVYLLVTVLTPLTVDAQYKATWIDLKNVNMQGNTLVKTASGNLWDAGAMGANVLQSRTDGWLEFVVPAGTSTFEIGFAMVDGASFTNSSFRNGIMIKGASGDYSIYEGSTITKFSDRQPGDVFRISRHGGNITYARNGNVFRTVPSDTILELRTKAAIRNGSCPAVTTSFNSRLFLNPNIQHIRQFGNDGMITLNPEGGRPPYTYMWSSGEQTSVVADKSAGTYSVTVTDQDGLQQAAIYNIANTLLWANLTGITEQDGSFQKTSSNGWNSGATSSTVLQANSDGWIEWILPERASSLIVGFATAANNYSKNSFLSGVMINPANGTINIVEGNAATIIGSYLPGDVLRLSREGSTVKYFRNDSLMFDVATAPNLQLYFKVSIHKQSDSIPISGTTSFQSNPVQIKMDNWAFQYKYDSKKRMIAKKVPGADWMYMIYDSRDRLVLSQTATQRQANHWFFTKYDNLNRPVLTGIKDTSLTLTQAEMQAVVDNFYHKPSAHLGETSGGSVHGYSNRTYPVLDQADQYLTVTYYDDYRFMNPVNGSTRLGYVIDLPGEQPTAFETRLRGSVTGSKVKVLDGGPWGGSSWLHSVTYYDKKLRVIQSTADNLKGGIDRTTFISDYTGKILKSKTIHMESDPTWLNKSGVAVVGNKIVRTKTGGDWIAGASSQQILQAGEDGWLEVEFVAPQGRVAFGLDSKWGQPFQSIDYCVQFNGNTLRIFENGASKTPWISSLVTGDTIRIERAGTTMSYKKNGLPIYTSQVPSSMSLVANLSAATYRGAIRNVRSSFSTTTHSVTRRMEYDHTGRLLRTWHRLDDANEILLSQNEYNAIGQLVDKKLHSEDSARNFSQSLDYRYNIRGWLTTLNGAGLEIGTANDDGNDLFGFDLVYDQPANGLEHTPQYNGNISALAWSNNLGQGHDPAHGYKYSYDGMNRIARAGFQMKTSGWSQASGSAFSESEYSYDLNGNILGLSRRGAQGVLVDSITYDYGLSAQRSNQLLNVTDYADKHKGFADVSTSGPDYSYDQSGNMLTDQNKGINNNIVYNHLNLPETVTRGTSNSIQYIYDANGRKLSQVTNYSTSQKNTDYVGEFQYENDVLQFVTHEEGRIVLTSQRQVYRNEGDNVVGISSSGVDFSAASMHGGESYVSATITESIPRPGIELAEIGVTGGQRFLIRLKGYRTGPANHAVHIILKVNGVDFGSPGAVLPNGPTVESWIEQTVTIPEDGTSLSVGVSWPANFTTGSSFHINSVGVSELTLTAPEHQYNFEDHLGNVRMTFTTKKEKQTNRATLEPANELREAGEFLRLDKVRKVNSHLLDHTNGSAPTTADGYAQRLNGSVDERIGLAKSISVMPGDTVRAEVFVKYIDREQANWTSALSVLMSQLLVPGTAPTGMIVDAHNYAGNGTTPVPWAQPMAMSTGESPNAGLTYVLFDRDYNLIFDPTQTNFVTITDATREYGQDIAHERLFAEVIVNEPGYMYVYLSNNEEQPVDVYFDDFNVEHARGPVVQMDSYYPFGERFNSVGRENSTFQNRLYNNGSDLQVDLDLNVYETQFRIFDPVLGRWWQVDPKPDVGGQESMSSYQYSFNSPIRFNDPDGDCPPVSSCAALMAAAQADAAVRPNGVGAHGVGFIQGLANSVTGLVNAVTNPGETLQGLGNLALASLAGHPGNAKQIDAALGTNSYGAMAGFTNAVSSGAKNLVHGNGAQRGELIGQIAGAIAGSKGLGAGLGALKGAATSEGFLLGSISIRTPVSIPVQRFGAMSIQGQSAFGLRTGSSPFVARTFNAILPKWNNLTNYTIGTIPKGTPLNIGITAPQGLKYPGGLLQFNVKPRLVTDQTTKLVN